MTLFITSEVTLHSFFVQNQACVINTKISPGERLALKTIKRFFGEVISGATTADIPV